jgi:3-dehydroquinate dehydratase type I
VTARICVSILPTSNLEALTLVERAEKFKADFIEVRLDSLETSRNLYEIVRKTKIPLIASNKLRCENGNFSGTEKERQHTLINAAKNGFEYVDVNLLSPNYRETIETLKQLGIKPIVSYHNFDDALSVTQMEKILEQEIKSGAEVCKIATTAKKIEDNLSLLNFISAMSRGLKLVCFCMGENGKISRLLSPLFGAFFTFASIEQGSETAAGQMSIQEMRSAYSLLGVK